MERGVTPYLHPADACSNCIAPGFVIYAHPVEVLQTGPVSVSALYACPHCQHTWATGWNTEALANYSCPECGEEYQASELRRPA